MPEEFNPNFEALYKGVLDEVERFLRRVLEKLRADAVRIIDENNAVATAQLRKNINIEILKEAARITGVVGVGSNVPYGIFRHENTKPHFPPVEAIMKWVIKKGLIKIANRPTTIRRLRKENRPELAQARAIAFLIARKISKQGTRGLAFLRMAFNQNASFIAEQFASMKIA